jgi:lysozyme family protein
MANFKEAYNITLGHEGGYVNDATDRGGETYKGIARKIHPTWGGWVIIDKHKSETNKLESVLNSDANLQLQVEAFYKKEFWDVANLDLISSQKIANKIFDAGVNQGIGSSVKYFKEALNLCGGYGLYYPEIVVDGGLGKTSINTFDNYMKLITPYRNKESNEEVLFKSIDGLQFLRYYSIVSRDKSQYKFWYGWVRTRLGYKK